MKNLAQWALEKRDIVVTWEDKDSDEQATRIESTVGVISGVSPEGVIFDFKTQAIEGTYFLPWHTINLIALA